jgi:integrase/recombinase XerD
MVPRPHHRAQKTPANPSRPAGLGTGSPETKRRKRRLPKTISRPEAAALLAAPNTRAPTGLRNRCLLELMYRGGLRVGEALALAPRDVDLSSGTVRVLDGKGGDGTGYFDESVRPWLEQWVRERRHYSHKDSPLFCTLKGNPVSVRYVEAMVKRMAKRAGITSTVTPHVLRHTFATELLDEGANIRQVQEALRHADVSTTMIYTHVLDTQLRSLIRKRKRSG